MTDIVASEDELRSLYGTPSKLAVAKQIDRLDVHARRFIELSPFLVISSHGADGLGDVSPKGDAPGFVQVLDDRTLLIPDRPGNNRLDTLSNVTVNDGVGLLFMVPGVCETLRVNGRARIVTDDDLLTPTAVRGRLPTAGILVAVAEVYLHCAKALVRSKLWDDDHRVERRTLPSLARIISDQVGGGFDVADAEARIEDSLKNKLY